MDYSSLFLCLWDLFWQIISNISKRCPITGSFLLWIKSKSGAFNFLGSFCHSWTDKIKCTHLTWFSLSEENKTSFVPYCCVSQMNLLPMILSLSWLSHFRGFEEDVWKTDQTFSVHTKLTITFLQSFKKMKYAFWSQKLFGDPLSEFHESTSPRRPPLWEPLIERTELN